MIFIFNWNLNSFVIDYLFSLEINSFFFSSSSPSETHFLPRPFLFNIAISPRTFSPPENPFPDISFHRGIFFYAALQPLLAFLFFFFFLLFEFLPREGRCNFVYNPQPVILHSRITNVEAFLSLLFHHGGFGITQGKSRIDYFLLSGGGEGGVLFTEMAETRKEGTFALREDR